MSVRYLENIINSGLFRHIRKSDYMDAFEQLRITGRTYGKGEMIAHQGDVIDSLCIVESGSVRGEKTYPDGEVHLVSVFDAETIFALEVVVSRMKTTPVDLIANENCRVLFVPMRSIEQSAYRERLQIALIEMLADENIRKSNKIEILAERGLRNRVLVYLNILAKKAGSNLVQVKMSREQMAQYLCVNRSALSNELNKMRREGLIDFRRGQFRLLAQESEQREETSADGMADNGKSLEKTGIPR